MGSVIKSISSFNPLATVLSGGSLTDMLLGKKDPGTPDKVTDIMSQEGKDVQSELLKQYKGLLGGAGIGQELAAQEAQARQNIADQERRAQQAVAQRGLGRTATGLSAILNPQKQLADQISAIRAQAPGMMRNNLNMATSGINQILGVQNDAKIFQQGQASKGRQGGLAPLIGGAVGAAVGGPAGAQVGMGLGQAATQLG